MGTQESLYFSDLPLQAFYDRHVFESGDISRYLTDTNELLQQAAHDFTRASFGQTSKL